MIAQEVKAEDDNRDFGCGSGTRERGSYTVTSRFQPFAFTVILSVDSLNGYRKWTTVGGPAMAGENLPRSMVSLQ